MLLKQYPNGQHVFDNHGHLPFHKAFVGGDFHVVEHLIDLMHGVTLPPTKDGTPPLFLDGEKNRPLDVICKLVHRSQDLFSCNRMQSENPEKLQSPMSKKRRL
jgi:hypothetical protein